MYTVMHPDKIMAKYFRYSNRMFAKMAGVGLDPETVLRRARLSQDLLKQPRILLKTDELFALWRATGGVAKDPAAGFLLGTETRIERFSPTGLAALSCENFGEAVNQIARYKPLTCPEELSQRKEGDEWRIQFRWVLSVEPEPPMMIDCAYAYLLSIARVGTGRNDLRPLRVEFIEKRAHRREIEQHFGCKVSFGASRNAIVFRVADAQLPFVTRNAELLEMLAPQFEEQLARDERFLDRVRLTIQERLTGRRPTIEMIADMLHMGSRTLQRRLQEEGSNFQRVLEEARHELARRYLKNPVLELNEAAYLLGYEDAGSFVRAFRSWEGVPPARWREEQRAKCESQGVIQ